MLNQINPRTPILALILFVFSTGYVTAANKVVVIPMGGHESATQKVIFITKGVYNGNLGGLSGADAKCQADADASGSKVKGKIFKAWLGPVTDPLAGERQFIVHDLPYVTPNRTEYIQNYASLIGSSPWPFLSIGADGTDVTHDSVYDDVWTGRLVDGTSFDKHCQTWSTDDPAEEGTYFGETFIDSRIFSGHAYAGYCNRQAIDPITDFHLVCMEQ